MKEAQSLLGGEKAAPAKGADKKPSAKSPSKVKEIRIRPGHAGGYIVKNHLEDKNGYAEQEFPMGKLSHVLKHVRAHMPKDDSEQGEAQEGMTKTAADC